MYDDVDALPWAKLLKGKRGKGVKGVKGKE